MLLAEINAFAVAVPTESPQVKIVINGKAAKFENPAIIVSGRTLLPLRATLTNLGVGDNNSIMWNDAEKSVTINKDDKNIFLKVGKGDAILNGSTITMDVAPIIYKSRTYIPVRFVSQSLGKKVAWNPNTYTVLISELERFNEVSALDARTENATKDINIKTITKTSLTVGSLGKVITNEEIQKDVLNKIRHELNRTSKAEQVWEDEKYYTETFDYFKKSPSVEWTKMPRAPEAKKENREAFNAGLNLDKQTNPDEILLDGDVCMIEPFSDAKDDPSYKEHSSFVMDSKTNLIKTITVKISGITKIFTGKPEYAEALIEMSIEKLPNDFKITLPKELETAKLTGVAKDFITENKRLQITLPTGWEENKEKLVIGMIEATETKTGLYVRTLEEMKQAFPQGFTLEKYRDAFVKGMKLENKKVLKVKQIKVDGFDALQYEVAGKIESFEFVYIIVTVETSIDFMSVVTIAIQDRMEQYRAELEGVLKSIRIFDVGTGALG